MPNLPIGSRRKETNGYIKVKQPDCPVNHRGWVYEHIYIVWKHTGIEIKHPMCVHHIDGDRTNNNPNNLVVCPDRAYHHLLHRREKALEVVGDPNQRPCNICLQYDEVKNLTNRVDKKGEGVYFHFNCRTKYNRYYYQGHKNPAELVRKENAI
jgi:hypothetical protein